MSTRNLVFSALFFFFLLGVALATSGCGSNAADDDPSLSDDNSGQAPDDDASDDDVYIDDDSDDDSHDDDDDDDDADDDSDDDDSDDDDTDDDTSDDDTDDDSDDDDTSDDDNPSGGSIDAPDPDQTVGPQFWVTGDVDDPDGIVEAYVTLYWGTAADSTSVVVYAGDGTDDNASFNVEIDVVSMDVPENEWFTMKLKVRDENNVTSIVDVVDLKWSNDSDDDDDSPSGGYISAPLEDVEVGDIVNVGGQVTDADGIKKIILRVIWSNPLSLENITIFEDSTPSSTLVEIHETVDLTDYDVNEGDIAFELVVTDAENRSTTVDRVEVVYDSNVATTCDGSDENPFRLKITCNSSTCITYTSQDDTVSFDSGETVTVSWLAEDYAAGDDLWVGASTTTRPTFSDVGDCQVMSWRTADENGWEGEWYVTVGD